MQKLSSVLVLISLLLSLTAATTLTANARVRKTIFVKATSITGEQAVGENSVRQEERPVIRVIPENTRIPIIWNTPINSDASDDEVHGFFAETAEDVSSDGSIVLPKGAMIIGRFFSEYHPHHSSVELKFDSIIIPDNRGLPLAAQVVAHGGVVHVTRGLADVRLDTNIQMSCGPVQIGLVRSPQGVEIPSPKLTALGNMIGRSGVLLYGKRNQRVELMLGDQLKIQLLEDLRVNVD